MVSLPPGVGDREIFVAVVAPVGGPVEPTLDVLRAAFEAQGYVVEDVRISRLLDTSVPTEADDETVTQLRRLMNKGDAFRKRLADEAACGYLAAQAISRARELATGDRRVHRPSHVNLIRSLKTAAEVRLLRSIYGDRLVVVGVSASKEERREELRRQLRADVVQDVEAEATYLLERDEKDDTDRFGQRASDAYRLSDAFVAAKTVMEASVVERLVGLLLGEPFLTPTIDEQAMFHAWAAKFRSSAAGRQVGAVIVDSDGEIVVAGCNDVPKPGGGQYWEGDDTDRRDFQLRFDANDQGKHGMARDVLQRLAEAGWLRDDFSQLSPNDRASTALTGDGPLRKSELDDLIEYGRIVHAEMAALMTAARSGRAVRDGTLYTTTYPCHECARLIIAAGISRVCFIDPYVKSRAPGLFATMWNQPGGGDGVLVEPFEGISPRLFPRVFEMSNRSKNVEGAYERWKEKRLLMGDEEIADSVPAQEDAAGAYLAARLAETEAAARPIMKSAEESGAQ